VCALYTVPSARRRWCARFSVSDVQWVSVEKVEINVLPFDKLDTTDPVSNFLSADCTEIQVSFRENSL
jgi:hypothetical protein